MKGFIFKSTIATFALFLIVFLTSKTFATNTDISESTRHKMINKKTLNIGNNDSVLNKSSKINSGVGCMACHQSEATLFIDSPPK